MILVMLLMHQKIKHELGWMPKETFETGLKKTVQWYLDNRQWWEKVLLASNHLGVFRRVI